MIKQIEKLKIIISMNLLILRIQKQKIQKKLNIYIQILLLKVQQQKIKVIRKVEKLK